jgi:hypothetical protein
MGITIKKYPIIIAKGTTINQLVEAGKYQAVGLNLSNEILNKPIEDTIKKNLYLVRFNKSIGNIWIELNEKRMIGANLIDLLAFSSQYDDFKKRYLISAVDTMENAKNHVPCVIKRKNGIKTIIPTTANLGWGTAWNFLANPFENN